MNNNTTQKNTKEKILLDLLDKYNLFPQRFLVFAGKQRVIYSYAGKNFKKAGYAVSHFGIFKTTGDFHDRSRILDDVLKLEFLVSQIILAKLSDKKIDFFNYKEINKWNKFLDDVTFYKKTDFLLNFDLINKKDWKKLDKIRSLRNQAAHSLNGKYLEYDGSIKDEKEQFELFRKDLEYSWQVLADIYHDIWSADEIFDHAIKLIEDDYGK